MRSVFYMMWKEVLELRQDPRIFSIIFITPILQLTILGYAATTDVRNVPVVIVDADRSGASQALISRFSAVDTFTIVDVVSNIDEVDPYLEGGRAWMALAIPSRYGENLATGRPVSRPDLALPSRSSAPTARAWRRPPRSWRRARRSGSTGGFRSRTCRRAPTPCASPRPRTGTVRLTRQPP